MSLPIRVRRPPNTRRRPEVERRAIIEAMTEQERQRENNRLAMDGVWKYKCSICGCRGHLRLQCERCSYCKTKGHFKSQCPKLRAKKKEAYRHSTTIAGPFSSFGSNTTDYEILSIPLHYLRSVGATLGTIRSPGLHNVLDASPTSLVSTLLHRYFTGEYGRLTDALAPPHSHDSRYPPAREKTCGGNA
jgi:plasmid stability protein